MIGRSNTHTIVYVTSTAAVIDPIAELVASLLAGRLPEPKRCKEIRERAGVALRPAAKAVGVTPWALSQWERGVNKPTPEHAARYARLLAELERVVS